MGAAMRAVAAMNKIDLDAAKKKTGGDPIMDIDHGADEHGPTTNTLDAVAGPERKSVRIEKKQQGLGLGGRGGRRSPNGGGLNIGGY